MPTVTVRHFAQLREQRQKETETIEVPPGTSLQDLYALLFPQQAAGELTVGFAQEHRIVGPETLVMEGAEVAFLPPFGGG